MFRGGLDINVVHADARAAHDAELGRGFDDFARHLGFGADDHRHGVRRQRQQLGLGQTLGQNGHLKFRPLL